MNKWKFYLLEKLANQSIFNSAFMIEMINNSFYESKSNFLLIKWETSKQKETYGCWKRCVLIRNILQKCLEVKEVFGKCRSSHQRCSVEIRVLKSFTKVTGKHLCQTLWMEALAPVFYCEFCEIFNSTFFTEHLRTTASISKYIFKLVCFCESCRESGICLT